MGLAPQHSERFGPYFDTLLQVLAAYARAIRNAAVEHCHFNIREHDPEDQIMGVADADADADTDTDTDRERQAGMRAGTLTDKLTEQGQT